MCGRLTERMSEIAMKLICVVALALAISVRPTTAGDGIQGAGVDSCGEWSQVRRIAGAQNVTAFEKVLAYESWIYGFISGMNVTNTLGDLLANAPRRGNACVD